MVGGRNQPLVTLQGADGDQESTAPYYKNQGGIIMNAIKVGIYDLAENVQEELENYENLFQVSENTWLLEDSENGANRYCFMSKQGEYLMESTCKGSNEYQAIIERFKLDELTHVSVRF